MNRRKAILRIAGIGMGSTLIYPAYKWHEWHKTPHFSYLDDNKPLLGALVECIIPATDTPGAKESGTHEFIISYVKDCADRRSANAFIDGMKTLQQYALDTFDKPFQDCSDDNQTKILTHFQQQGKPMKGIIGKVQQKYMGRSFFTLLREFTVEGYCTSELGATHGLAYVAIPGNYHGHLMMQRGQKGWATK